MTKQGEAFSDYSVPRSNAFPKFLMLRLKKITGNLRKKNKTLMCLKKIKKMKLVEFIRKGKF